ncbi:MAG: hypothetical protein HWN66_12930 [Candidatus Helarchaeota archaeon]|nr:hypothetical protein [Candidatus Helarchaeota archaeon]
MSEDESKKIMKKLITVLSTISETVQALEEKISQSSRQVELLSRQVGKIEAKIDQLDMEVEDEVVKLGQDPSQVQTQREAGFQQELDKINKEIDLVPEEVMDDELKRLLEEEKESKQKKKE